MRDNHFIPWENTEETEIPSVDTPDLSSVDFGDVDSELMAVFWKLVIALKVAIFALSLGTLFLVFQQNVLIGGPLVAIGSVAGGYSLIKYRRYQAHH